MAILTKYTNKSSQMCCPIVSTFLLFFKYAILNLASSIKWMM